MTLRLSLIITTIMLLMATACSGDGDFSRFERLPENGWAYGDTLMFDTTRPDSLSRGNLSLAMRHSGEYQYANIWLEVSYNDNGHIRRDTLNIPLADNYGRWLGKGFGSTRQLELPVARDILPLTASRIGVRHIMRVDTLRGVREIGVVFEAAGNN